LDGVCQEFPVEGSINAFLVQDGTRTILVDTGSGDLFGPGNGGKLLESLSGVGVKAGDDKDGARPVLDQKGVDRCLDG
ncbi:hypothetical protein ACC676_39785, partial [Rhizobium ruizarguesonis]